MSIAKRLSKILLSPWMALTAIVSGFVFGVYQPNIAGKIAPFGDIYLALLQMCVLPLILSAIITSFYSMTRSPTGLRLSRLLISLFLIFMLVASFVGYLGAEIGNTGVFSQEAKYVLGDYFLKSEDEFTKTEFIDQKKQGWGVVGTLIPTNIFLSLAEGHTLEVVFFAMLIGIALGLIKVRIGKTVFTMFEALYEAIFKIIVWVLHGLPFGVFCIMAGFISSIGMDIINALLNFIAVFAICCFTLMLIYLIVISIAHKISLIKAFEGIEESLLVAFGTQSFIATIPEIIKDLQENFKIDEDLCKLIVPLGITINRQGVALVFSFVTITVAQIYDVFLSTFDIIFIIFGCAIIAMAAIGPVITTAALLHFVLQPLDVPTGAAFVFIVSTAPIISPLIVAVTANGVAMVTVVVSKYYHRIEK
jgi:Na+/H+-dicarboxylate symporter